MSHRHHWEITAVWRKEHLNAGKGVLGRIALARMLQTGAMLCFASPSTQLLIMYLVICERAWKMDYPHQLLAAMAEPSPVPL